MRHKRGRRQEMKGTAVTAPQQYAKHRRNNTNMVMLLSNTSLDAKPRRNSTNMVMPLSNTSLDAKPRRNSTNMVMLLSNTSLDARPHKNSTNMVMALSNTSLDAKPRKNSTNMVMPLSNPSSDAKPRKNSTKIDIRTDGNQFLNTHFLQIISFLMIIRNISYTPNVHRNIMFCNELDAITIVWTLCCGFYRPLKVDGSPGIKYHK